MRLHFWWALYFKRLLWRNFGDLRLCHHRGADWRYFPLVSNFFKGGLDRVLTLLYWRWNLAGRTFDYMSWHSWFVVLINQLLNGRIGSFPGQGRWRFFPWWFSGTCWSHRQGRNLPVTPDLKSVAGASDQDRETFGSSWFSGDDIWAHHWVTHELLQIVVLFRSHWVEVVGAQCVYEFRRLEHFLNLTPGATVVSKQNQSCL